MTTSHTRPETEVEAYERELADYLGVEHVVTTSSGTTALHTALHAVGVGPGHEVLVPAVAVVMSAAPILHLGARPVIVDCDPEGHDFDYRDLAARRTHRATTILPVHLWGRPGNTERLRRFAQTHNLRVVVDACQALGTTIDSVQAGTRGVTGCFSTHELKLLSTGQGGFITTDDADVAAGARAYRSHWVDPPPGQSPRSRLAHNFRLAEPLAALGRRELRRLTASIRRRTELTQLLVGRLDGVPHLRPVQVSWPQPPAQTEQPDAACITGGSATVETHRAVSAEQVLGTTIAEMPSVRWNHYAPLLRLDLPRPHAFSQHLAAAGVPNSTGSFGLVPLDQVPMFTEAARPPCVEAARFLDGILAVALTRDDAETTIRRYADTITREVTRWVSA